MKHPYLYGALVGIIVVGIFLTGYNYGYKDATKDWKYIAKSMCIYWQETGQISGGYDLQEIQK